MNRRFCNVLTRSFSGKVFASVLGMLILLTCTFTLFSLLSQRENFERELTRDGRILAGVLADNTRLGLFAQDSDQLAAAVEIALGVKDVAGACVFDLKGQLRQRKTSPAWEQTEICRRLPPVDPKPVLGETAPEPRQVEGEKTVMFWQPVLAKPGQFSEDTLFFPEAAGGRTDQPQRIGTVALAFDKGVIHKKIRKMLVQHALILVLFLVIGSLAAYYLVLAVTRPLSRLVGEIKAQGGVTGAGDDELGMLSDTFGSMVQTLGSSFATINELKSGLERKVGELEQEIRKRQRSEAALRESEEKFRSISERIADGVAIVRGGVFVWANHAFCVIFDCCASELAGQDAATLLPQPGQRSGSPWLMDCLGGKEAQVRYLTPCRRGDGAEILVEVNARKIVFEHQEGIQVIVRDITEQDRAERERKELEIKALAQSKLASLGKIATGVAHEINQPLTYIRIAYESALRDMDRQQFDPAEAREYFHEALRQVGRITLITDHLRSFGRSDSSLFAEVSLPEVLANSLTLMGETLRLADITLEREIGQELPRVWGNSVQLEQVFINLFQNSVDALALSTDKRIRVRLRQENGMLEALFSDSGPGIPPEARENIFTPFYSTKGEDRTGLGLAIVSTIIREHGGTIVYRVLPGWGASFVVLLLPPPQTNKIME